MYWLDWRAVKRGPCNWEDSLVKILTFIMSIQSFPLLWMRILRTLCTYKKYRAEATKKIRAGSMVGQCQDATKRYSHMFRQAIPPCTLSQDIPFDRTSNSSPCSRTLCMADKSNNTRVASPRLSLYVAWNTCTLPHCCTPRNILSGYLDHWIQSHLQLFCTSPLWHPGPCFAAHLPILRILPTKAVETVDKSKMEAMIKCPAVLSDITTNLPLLSPALFQMSVFWDSLPWVFLAQSRVGRTIS